MEGVSMVALSGCIWLQWFVVALEANSFTRWQHLAIWGNLLAFYINLMLSAIPSSGMYTIMFQLCRQPSYWLIMLVIVRTGMGPILALKYFRYTYRPSQINKLQQAGGMGDRFCPWETLNRKRGRRREPFLHCQSRNPRTEIPFTSLDFRILLIPPGIL
ncbi:phospholipid-transporting ATPase 2-like [Rhodamnia argentea]|uniref:Phospholipid-transporting ATPase 2-like n=1 Tax=Rhodamnia argentea TaxID=178133 RepID=A0ABM3HMX9_9MYRT|nr:phospholipid-transporting ATPase 2-like [Rhodamnia argentea]